MRTNVPVKYNFKSRALRELHVNTWDLPVKIWLLIACGTALFCRHSEKL